MMRIGLPSALVNIYYRSFWRTFFTELGAEVVETGVTTKEILDKGIRWSVPEICVPMKIYTGHVVKLLEEGVDFVYVPRFVSIRRGDTFCPKFLGLPDMLRYTLPGLAERILTHHLVSKSDEIAGLNNYLEVGKALTSEAKKVKKALEKGRAAWRRFRELCTAGGYDCRRSNEILLENKGFTRSGHPIKLGVIGYVYNVYDSFISMNILDRLEALGAEAVTFEMLDEKELEMEIKKQKKPLFWTFSNKLYAAASRFYRDPGVDGLIHVTAFGCGPDSFLGKVLEIDSVKYKKPFMTVRVDEHTGENHLQTRIEAFVDMIAKRKHFAGRRAADEDHLSLYGTDLCLQKAN